MPKYNYNFGNDILLNVESNYFTVPFGQRETTEKLLKSYSEKLNSALIAIDGSKASSNILTNNANNLDISDINFLEQGIDGVILTGLNDIKQEQFGTKTSVGIILGSADCAPITGVTKDGNTMFNLHVGYKGLFGNGEETNPGIIFNFFNELEKLGIYPSNFGDFHIGPMAGKNFELPVSYFNQLVKYFSKQYKFINLNDYFDIRGNKNKNGELVGNIDLKGIIEITLKYHGASFYSISDSGISTTDKSNTWPSHRLFSKGNQRINNRISTTIGKIVV